MSVFTVQTIAQIFTLCGVVSVRMFLPVFTYFLLLRLAVAFPTFAPSLLTDMAARVPEWQISLPFLAVTGVLALLELAALRNPDIKEFLTEEVDKFAKPLVAILLACSVMNTTQADEVRKLFEETSQLQQAGIGLGCFLALLGGAVTASLCHCRSVILEKLHVIDPDNSMRLHTISNAAGEILILLALLLLVVLPMAALILTILQLAVIVIGKKWLHEQEKKSCHPCPHCQGQTFDSAMICPACGTEQTDVRRVGRFGLPTQLPLSERLRTKHCAELLTARRCRWCATLLESGKATCDACGKHQWEDEAFFRYYLRRTDIRAALLLLLSVLSFLLPIVGCTVVMIFFRPYVLRPMMVHLGLAARFGFIFLNVYFKLLAMILLLLLSAIPGVGLVFILPFLMRYLSVRRKFKNTFAPSLR